MALVWLAERVLPLLPTALVGATSEFLGTVAYLVAGGARHAVRANLAVIAPDRTDREHLVRRTFVNQVRNYIEVFRVPRLRPATLLAAIRTQGWEHFVAAHARGGGVIAASAHLGPISLCGQLVLARGYELVLPIEREGSDFMRAVNRARTGMGLRFVPTDSALGIHRVLREGRVLGMLADRAVTGVGERVPFFGREALLPSAHVALALRTGAALVPAFAGRDGDTLTADFEAPLELPHTGDRDTDVREGVRRWASVLERYVRRAPEQWTVFEPVWGD